MKRNLFWPALSVLITLLLSFCTSAEHKVLKTLKDEVRQDLEKNLLPYWSEKVMDRENGGFHGRVDIKDSIHKMAERGGVVNSRILWTFSSAYRVLKNPEYLRIARFQKDYIEKHFIDKEFGGAFRSVGWNGEPMDMRKQIYIQSFFMYAFSEYARATGDTGAVRSARMIFECIERYASDSLHGGYFEVFTRDWKRSRERLIGEKSDRDEKTMNTHLHLLESYTSLYRVWPDPLLKEKLRELIIIFRDHIVDGGRFHLIPFMERDWKSTSGIDSYGHDIESSWLLCEAVQVLGDKQLIGEIRELSIKIADAAAQGLWPDGSLATEKDLTSGHKGTRRSWWEQSETVVGYLNAWEVSGEGRYLDIAVKNWTYIKDNFIDKNKGGWFSSVNEDGTPGTSDKAGFWICPYHNGRMCLEVIERADHLDY